MLQGLNDKERLVIDINDNFLKIAYGSSSHIKNHNTFKLPEQCVVDGNLVDLDAIKKVIDLFLAKVNVRNRNVSFCIHGQDVVVRQVECPIMNKKGLKEAAEWEIGQNLPSNGANHYIDFEIIKKVTEKDKKMYKLLVAAVPKEKVDLLVKLSESLLLKVQSIDVYSNCVARVFSKLCQPNRAIAVVDIGDVTSSFIIIDSGKLFIEREVPFGLNTIKSYIARKENIGMDFTENHLNEIDFSNLRVSDETQTRVKVMMDNVFSTFQKVVHFYSTGRVAQGIDCVYVIGSGAKLNGIEYYVKAFFNSQAKAIHSPSVLNFKVKTPRDGEFSSFISNYGLLMRKE